MATPTQKSEDGLAEQHTPYPTGNPLDMSSQNPEQPEPPKTPPPVADPPARSVKKEEPEPKAEPKKGGKW